MKAKRFYFDFKGLCAINDVFVAPLQECAHKKCAPLDINPVQVLPTGEQMLQFTVLCTGIQRRSFEFVIRQACGESPGLLISDTTRREEKRSEWANVQPRPPKVTYNLTPIASAVDVGVCLEEFRSYFHIAMFKCLCRCKYTSAVLNRRLDDIDRLDTHYEMLKTAVEVNSDDIGKLRDQLATIEKRLQVSEERWASRKKRRTVE